jgi:hypothetical protein
MAPAKTNKNLVSVHYAEQETGWVEPLPDGTFRICNIPLADSLNVDDVVTLTPGNPECCVRPKVDHVISSKYPYKVIVAYRPTAKGDYKGHYKKVSSAVVAIGGKCEGFSPGFAGVAVQDLGELQERLDGMSFKTEIELGEAHGDES